jgi:2-keto-4-pentenoate hydratase
MGSDPVLNEQVTPIDTDLDAVAEKGNDTMTGSNDRNYIIMTGTPSGVAATVAGDKIECEVEGVGKLTVTIGPPLK